MTGGWGDQLSPRRASPLRCVTGDRSLKSDAPRQSTPSGGTTRRSGVCASNPLSEVYTACPLMRAEAKFNGAHFEGPAGFVQGFGSPGAREHVVWRTGRHSEVRFKARGLFTGQNEREPAATRGVCRRGKPGRFSRMARRGSRGPVRQSPAEQTRTDWSTEDWLLWESPA